MIVAIDGPAGAGKTTVAKGVAQNLGFTYIDTGAMYRAVTFKAMELGLDLSDEEAVSNVAEEIDIHLDQDCVYVNGNDVSTDIRKPEVTRSVVRVADNPGVRKRLVEIQRSIGQRSKWAVLEGRDISSVVFPDAEFKFYLDASIEERVRRRYEELKEKGIEVEIERLKEEIAARDEQDKNRQIGPLRIDKDAVYIDTTSMDVADVISRIVKEVKGARPNVDILREGQ